MQNQIVQQSFIESSSQKNSITFIHLAKNRHKINGLLDALKSIYNTCYNDNLAINSLTYARNVLQTSPEIDHRLNQLQNGLRKGEFGMSTIYNYIDSLRS